jgi:hypothetical protein
LEQEASPIEGALGTLFLGFFSSSEFFGYARQREETPGLSKVHLQGLEEHKKLKVD